MVSKALIIAAVIAYVEARFGQEQLPINAISQVQGGDPGAASTIAGAAISDLLGAASSCAKLQRADEVVAKLGGGADAIAAAIGLVTAEKNTNPFAGGNAQNVCADPSLPATAELRGITPLIDPDVDTNGDAAALSASSASNPLNADGLSVFDLMSQAGLGDLVVAQDGAGGAAAGGAAGGAAAGGNANNNAGNNNANAGNGNNANAGNDNANNNTGNNNNADNNAGNNNNNAGNNDNAGNNAGNNAGAGNAAAGGEDFGNCTPTIIFEGGMGNRPDTEFTFQIADETARGGQGEALNPNIITNALCNQLTNVCNANAAAVAKCEDAKAQVQAAGTKDKSTADLFNSAIGFAGAVTNPSGGPANPPAAGAAANKRSMRRGFRA